MQQTVVTVLRADSLNVELRLPVATCLLRARQLVHCWLQRRRQRRALARLDDRLLRDIGVDAADAVAEVAKPFWRR